MRGKFSLILLSPDEAELSEHNKTNAETTLHAHLV